MFISSVKEECAEVDNAADTATAEVIAEAAAEFVSEAKEKCVSTFAAFGAALVKEEFAEVEHFSSASVPPTSATVSVSTVATSGVAVSAAVSAFAAFGAALGTALGAALGTALGAAFGAAVDITTGTLDVDVAKFKRD